MRARVRILSTEFRFVMPSTVTLLVAGCGQSIVKCRLSVQLADDVPATVDETDPDDPLVDVVVEDPVDVLDDPVDAADWRTGVEEETALRPVPVELCWVETWALVAAGGTATANPAVMPAPTPRAENA